MPFWKEKFENYMYGLPLDTPKRIKDHRMLVDLAERIAEMIKAGTGDVVIAEEVEIYFNAKGGQDAIDFDKWREKRAREKEENGDF
jgi:hypothetical protein